MKKTNEMRLTVVHKDAKGKTIRSFKTLEQLLQRIASDDSKRSVARFREAVSYLNEGYQCYNGISKWHYVYPAAEFRPDDNGNEEMKRCNGLLLLKFCGLTEEKVSEAKRAAAMLPSTIVALRGADNRSVVVLAKYADHDGTLPADEPTAERLYAAAARLLQPAYREALGANVESGKPSLRDCFMMTLDEEPYYNPTAMAMRVDLQLGSVNRKRCARIDEVAEVGNTDGAEGDGAAVAAMMRLLCSRYDYRYNEVMKCVEYQQKERSWYGYQPVDRRVMKRMTLEVQLANVGVSICDVRNFLESDFIQSYNPVDDFLLDGCTKWDGRDHIRQLAQTVPTDNPLWEDWFYTWFLGMVTQWRGGTNRLYGNSVAPLLISPQGYNKSTFCRRLLPPELQWGYNDNLVLTEKRQVLQAMSQFLLINLDEFNQISAAVQQGFLKNLVQLPTVKIKRPYGSRVEEFPRLASFIATSNMTDVLSDPSGNRRFLCVELTGPIDVSTRPNYRQLYAQALDALRRGEKTYFDASQVELIIENNHRFEVEQPVEQYFRLVYKPVKDERDGEYLAAAEIFEVLKSCYGSSIKVNSLMAFGRKLSNMRDLKRKRTMAGTKYLVGRI